MEKFYFENQGNGTYLVYEVDDYRRIDQLTMGMLTNNDIVNIAPFVYTERDGQYKCMYNVTAKVSLSQFLETTLEKKKFLALIAGILTAINDADEYMIDIRNLLLDEEKIFVDVSTGNPLIVCLPMVENRREMPDIREFFKRIVFSSQLNFNEENDYFIRIMNYLNGKNVFSVAEFAQLISSIQNPVEQNKSDQSKAQEKQVSFREPETNVEEVPFFSVQHTDSHGKEIPLTPPICQPGQGSSVIPQPSIPQPSTPPAPQEQKEISWLYLMQHYNKENKELYREQKERKKQREKEGEKAKGKVQKKDKKQGKKKDKISSAPSASMPFAVPGAPAGSGTLVIPPPAVPQPQVQHQFQPKPPTPDAPVSGLYARGASPEIPARRTNFGETTVLNTPDMVGATTVLTQNMRPGNEMPVPYLLRLKNNERILLNKPVFRIGKEKSYVDYFISDNTAISRSHADIMKREDGYYVVDRNSTNHTYVNDRMIQSGEEVLLEDGTKVRLANEEFEFQLRI